ncbi:MAG: hypothetical protein IKI15_10290 [Lachnospiraceae bacterium]|nr:hypothetical protein [Lachnospiraceae bacterium]
MGILDLTGWIQSQWFFEYAATISFCLIGTLLIEVTLALALGVRGWDDIEKVILINILTNPVLVTILFLINRMRVDVKAIFFIQLGLEVVVVILEGMYYKRKLQKERMNPFLLSMALNAVSYGAGLALSLL